MLAVAFYYVLIVTVFGWLIVVWFERRIDITLRKPGLLAESDPLLQLPKASIRARKDITSERVGEYALEAINIHKSYGNQEVLKGIDLNVKWGGDFNHWSIRLWKNDFYSHSEWVRNFKSGHSQFTGSTVLKGSRITENAPEYKNQIVHVRMVFQSFNLFPHKTILENVMLAPLYHKMGTVLDNKITALAMLEKVGMKQHANKYPHQLSGGPTATYCNCPRPCNATIDYLI